FELPVWGTVAWAPAEAAVFAAGETPRRRRTNPYLADVRSLMAVLAERTLTGRALVGVPG
ncbi:MAG: hypothetical protein WAL91_01705, partial [Propionicimonas sp.]